MRTPKAKTADEILLELNHANALDQDSIETNFSIEDLQAVEDYGESVDGDDELTPTFDLYETLLRN